MDRFDRLNQETRDWNNGISRNISPTDHIKHPVDFTRLNQETYRHNNYISRNVSPTRGIKASDLSGRFNSCYK